MPTIGRIKCGLPRSTRFSRRPVLDLFAYLAIIRRARSKASWSVTELSRFLVPRSNRFFRISSPQRGAFVKTTDFMELFASHAHLGQAAILEVLLSELGARRRPTAARLQAALRRWRRFPSFGIASFNLWKLFSRIPDRDSSLART